MTFRLERADLPVAEILDVADTVIVRRDPVAATVSATAGAPGELGVDPGAQLGGAEPPRRSSVSALCG